MIKSKVLQVKNLSDWSQRCIRFWQKTTVNIKKAKFVNRKVVTGISHNDYKDLLVNKEWLRHLMIRIQNKEYGIGTYQTNKSLSCFNDNIYF